MSHWLDNTWQHLQLGEALLVGGVEGLKQGWHAPMEIVGKLYSDASRWHETIRQMQCSVNLAEILRTRTTF